jgi:MFS family permease
MLSKFKAQTKMTFASLSVYNYRLYFIGQGLSQTGTWLQTIAQTWLVLQLTHSATLIGLLTAAQFLPVLLLGPFGGVITDRFPKRRTLYMTQSAAMLLAFILAALVLSHSVHVWMVFVLAGCLGLINVVDNPTRQTFIMEMVGRDSLKNAVTLNSIEINLARVIGPTIAAVLIANVGIGECFLVNGFSYLAVLAGLVLIRSRDLHVSQRTGQLKGQLREGLRYVRRTPVLLNILLMMAVIGTLSYEFPVVLPVFASRTFHGGASTYALLTAAMSIGAVVGGIITASRRNTSIWALPIAALLFGVCILLVAVAPSMLLASLLLVFVGIGSISFTAVGNSTLQLESDPAMRGRVMSLWTVAFLGSTPIGGPIIGWISEHAGPRWGLAVGGVAAIATAIFGAFAIRRNRRQQLLRLGTTLTETRS